MIRYRCEHCGTELESPKALAGKQDKCPACGRSCSVPVRSARPFLKGLLLGAALGAMVAGGAAVGAYVLLGQTPPREAASRAVHREPATRPPIARMPGAAGRRAPTESIEKLTGDDVIAFAQRHKMKALANWPDDDFRTWEGGDGLFVRCVWFPDSGKRIKEIFICRSHTKHGAEGQTGVLAAWRELCPHMEASFRTLFGTSKGLESGLQWIGSSPYGYGVARNNKAYVDYIGPQSGLAKGRVNALAAANVKINWYYVLKNSQKEVLSKIKGMARGKAQQAIGKQMGELAASFAYPSTSISVKPEYFTKHLPLEDAGYPALIPGFLSERSRTAFLRASAGISAIARAAQSSIQKTGESGFRPYDQMLVELSRYPECVSAAWGPYGRLAVARQKGAFPPKQQELLEQMAVEGLYLVFSDRDGGEATPGARSGSRDIGITDIGHKRVDSSSGHVTVAWKAAIHNRSDRTANFTVEAVFVDGDRFQLARDFRYGVVLDSGQRQTVGGTVMMTSSVYKSVVDLLVKVSGYPVGPARAP